MGSWDGQSLITHTTRAGGPVDPWPCPGERGRGAGGGCGKTAHQQAVSGGIYGVSGGQDLEQDLGASERWRHTGVECNSWATAPGAWAGLSQPEEAEERRGEERRGREGRGKEIRVGEGERTGGEEEESGEKRRQ